MLIYCFVCYLIMIGVLLKEEEHSGHLTNVDILMAIFAPIVVPILLGMYINSNNNKNES